MDYPLPRLMLQHGASGTKAEAGSVSKPPGISESLLRLVVKSAVLDVLSRVICIGDDEAG
jgi:hypothetical protein